MTKTQTILLSSIVFIGIGYGIGRYIVPPQVVTETIEKEKVKTITVIKDHKNVDGSSDTVTTIDQTSNSQTQASTTITTKKPDWNVSLMTGYSFNEYKQTYGLKVDRRILGNIFIGAYGTTNKEIGLSVGYEF